MHLTLKTAAALIATAMFTACGEPATTETAKEETPVAEETAPAVTYNVDVENSVVHWRGAMSGLKVYDHSGLLHFSEGTVTVKDEKVIAGNFVVDMTTITPTDENYDEEKKPEMLVGHLSSPDFFDVENHPTATLVLMEEGNAKLTVRGVTKDIVIEEIDLSEKAGELKGQAVFTFDRTMFDVAFSHPVKELILSNDIELSIDIMGSSN